MFTFKDKRVNDLTDEERFDLITDGCLREPIYDFGTELVTADDMIYECEYLSEEKSLKQADIDYTVKNYVGAKHAFTNPEASKIGKKFKMPLEYDEKAAKDSWDVLLKNLGKI